MKFRDWSTLLPIFLKCLCKLPASHLWYLARQFKNENPHHHNGRFYVNTFFPPCPSKAFNRFLDAVIDRKRVPYSTYFAVTDKCPFSCPHCSYGAHTQGSLSTEQALNVIEQIKSLGTVTIGFTGGEPLLRDDITQLVAAAGDEVATILFTTGHRLDKELANALAKADLDCMMIGIESANPEQHDKVRGVAGSFEQAIKAIDLSLKAGLYTAISTVATRDKINTGEIEKLAQLANKHAVHEFRVLEPIPTGSLRNQKNEVLSNVESQWLSDFHKQWNRKNTGSAISSFSYLESDYMFGCGAGFHHLFIDAMGNVCPCDLTPLSFGNVLQESLESIWLEMGNVFTSPRCGCLMKDLCENMNKFDGALLPLDIEKSHELCRTIGSSELPEVYKNLFKNRKPVSQPSPRQ